MDYLLDTYVFKYLPITLDPDTRKAINEKAMATVHFFDWVCKAQDPWKIWENHTSFLFAELVFFFLCALTFSHAYRHGGRLLFVWIGILIHALNVENLCYWIPDMDNFWQAQGLLTFFGARAPLYILLGIYHFFDYTSYVFVQRLHLPWWAEGPAVGLGAVMLDLPYDIMGIKLVWWTWHDTDPNIFDRFYWVPWNSPYFHAAFACSFVWILNVTRKYLLPEEYDWKLFAREFFCVFLAGTGAFWVGTIQFAALYHPLHDIYKVHSEVTTLLFLATYAVIVYVADRRNRKFESRTGNKWWFDELALAVLVHYGFYIILTLVSDPENIVAEGLHQPIGPCNITQKVQTPTGLVLQKKKYFCPTKYDEGYIDFHCVPGGAPKQLHPSEPLEWYAVCGTPYQNRVEYIAIITGTAVLFVAIFFQWAARSGETPKYPVKYYRRSGQQQSKAHRSPSPPAKSGTRSPARATTPTRKTTRETSPASSSRGLRARK